MDTAYDITDFSGNQARTGEGDAPWGSGLRGNHHEGKWGEVAIGGEAARRGKGPYPTPLSCRGGPTHPGGTWDEIELCMGDEMVAT